MKRLGLCIVLGLASACGFGLYDDSGQPDPSPNYWGWQCKDGTPVPADGGACLPDSCDGGATPAVGDGGACLCADGTAVLPSVCAGDAGG